MVHCCTDGGDVWASGRELGKESGCILPIVGEAATGNVSMVEIMRRFWVLVVGIKNKSNVLYKGDFPREIGRNLILHWQRQNEEDP